MNNKNNKIIGYKCPMDLFGGNVKKGDVFTKYSFMYYSFGNYRLPSEIVEQWEAVYEQEQYKVGEWLYTPRSEDSLITLFRFKDIENKRFSTDEGYVIYDDNSVACYTSSKNFADFKSIIKATDQQILDVLTKVAIHKGFKEGVRFKSAWSKKRNCINEKEFSLTSSGLCNYDLLIYCNLNRKWATILPIKLELPEGYVDNGNKTITAPNKKIQHYEWYIGVNYGAGGFQEVVNYINENK